MKKVLVFLTLLLILFSSCINLTGKGVRGEGPLVSQDRPVSKFNKVHSFGSFDVNISSGESSSVKVEAEQNLQEFIEIQVEDNTLNIKPRKNFNLNSPRGITISLSASTLSELKLYGSGTVKTMGRIESPDDLDIESSGSGDITYNLKGCISQGAYFRKRKYNAEWFSR